jgi:hypothetical protein
MSSGWACLTPHAPETVHLFPTKYLSIEFQIALSKKFEF